MNIDHIGVRTSEDTLSSLLEADKLVGEIPERSGETSQ